MICRNCSKEFEPIKNNQLYCDVLCRDRYANKRRHWDVMMAYVKRGELAAQNMENSAYRRKDWAQWAAKRRIELGQRP
jgi:hypothetical protein